MKPITNIRKAVTTLANKINIKTKDLSTAFKRSWQIVRGKVLLSKVAGTTFKGRQRGLARLAKYNPNMVSVELIREVDNQHDINAVGVHVSVNNSKPYQIGYLPKDIAQLASSLLDKGIKLITSFKGVTLGGTVEKFNYGALIEVNI